jgi:hypothetical protein
LSDNVFTFPAVDDAPSTEVGVILMGLDAERLLAGLGTAALGDDPALVATVVDHARHGVPTDLSLATVVATGAGRWRSTRAALAAAHRDSAAPFAAAVRKAWTQALDLAGTAGGEELGPASRAYLAACWLRRSEVDAYVEEHHGLSRVAP